MADEARETGPRRSVRGSEQRTTSKAEAFRPSSSRPTAAEREQAERRIEDMKAAPVEPPILSSRGRPPHTNIVACAIAFQRGEVFDSDEEAFRQFGVPERCDVRRIWVNDKLAKLAAYEQAQWQDRAVRAEAAWQDPHCANDAEREEDVADWKRSFDMPFEDTGTLLPLHTSSSSSSRHRLLRLQGLHHVVRLQEDGAPRLQDARIHVG